VGGVIISSSFYHLLVSTNRHSLLASGWLSILECCWRNTETVAVAEEKNAFVLTSGAFNWLNPVAPASTLPDRLDEAEGSTFGISAVVATHNWLDGLGSLVGMVEGDGANIVMENVGLNDAVEELTADETKFTVNGCSSSAHVVPRVASVVGEGDSN